MAWKFQLFVENATEFIAAVGNNIEEGIKEALERAAKPALAGNGEVKLGAVAKKSARYGNLTGNGALTAFKVKHELKSPFPNVQVYTNSAGKPGETTAVSKINIVSEEELEIVFSVAPTTGTSFWFSVTAA